MNRRRLAILVLAATGGCGAFRGPVSVYSEDPDLKIQAIKRDAAVRDDSHAGQLVHDLDDPDPAIRFYAAKGLQRLAGVDYGYRFYDDEAARKPAVARWRAWLASRAGPALIDDR